MGSRELQITDQIHFVSFPRSGRHWICFMLELYNQGKTYTDALSGNHWAEDMIGIIQHDIGGCFRRRMEKKKENSKLMYAYRDPINTVLSLHKYLNSDSNNKKNIIRSINEWCSHIDWWLYHSHECFNGDRLDVKFEDLECDAGEQLKRIISFIFSGCDNVRCEVIGKMATKDMISYVYDKWNNINKPILEYRDGEKEKFRTKYAMCIQKIIAKWPRVNDFCIEVGYL